MPKFYQEGMLPCIFSKRGYKKNGQSWCR